VKAGDVVKVKVLEVDQQRKRIALTMRLDDTAKRARDESVADGRRDAGARPAPRGQPARREPEAAPSGAMAEAFARARKQP
jgi:uncharacterized protein